MLWLRWKTAIAGTYYNVISTDRLFGARLSGEIANATVTWVCHLTDQARTQRQFCQSFGVGTQVGVELYLTGDANDYVGKGMAGGKMVIKSHHRYSRLNHEADHYQ